MDTPPHRFDVFMCHASEDKDKDVVRAITRALLRLGMKVWFDEMVILSRFYPSPSRPLSGCDLVRCAGRLHRLQTYLPPTAEDVPGGVAVDRPADEPAGPGTSQSAQPTPGSGRALGGGAWSRRGLSTADHCRGRCQGGDISFRQEVLFLGGSISGRRRERGGSRNHRSPKGNRHMRRVLNQAANAAAKSKGTIFEIVYRRLVSRLAHNSIKPSGRSHIGFVV